MGGNFWSALVFVVVGVPIAFIAAVFLAAFPFFLFSSMAWFYRKVQKRKKLSAVIEEQQKEEEIAERKAG